MPASKLSAIRKNRSSFKGFKKINMMIIPRCWMREQYKDSWGDYWVDEKEVLQIRAVEFQELDHSFRVLMHEVLEAWRIYRKGIYLSEIEEFDAKHADHDDPGSLKDAPYHLEHMQSNLIEDIMLLQDGYSPEDYEDPAEP